MPTPQELVSKLTLEEKALLCSGSTFWHLQGMPAYNLPKIMVADGPHGLRLQTDTADNLGLGRSEAATCFPAACATAASFNPALLREIGSALAAECLAQGVSVLLGPGINCKRSPLCGRNFEYFSEDPYLTAQLATAMVQGIQENGVSACVKHFAANNQETYRTISNSVVDARALHEIYLSAFRYVVQQAQPATVMSSYNRLNSTYTSEHTQLLTDILRRQWGFTGAVISDWGGVANRAAGVAAGMDIQMPGPAPSSDAEIVQAVTNGTLPMAQLDACVTRIIALIQACAAKKLPDFTFNPTTHHSLARRAAAESAVLLKNEGDILPLQTGLRMAVIGSFAVQPRYQGSGSSKINPFQLDSLLEELTAAGVAIEFAPGYNSNAEQAEEALLMEAEQIATACDIAVVVAGLPDSYESEGFDRTALHMPPSHNACITRVAAANPNTIVALQCGAPVEMPWLSRVRGLLLLYLGGQGVNGALADILLGKAQPTGRLPETWPIAIETVPCHQYFPGTPESVEYRESVFVGYRYYDTAKQAVAFPFGYGLSYSTFVLENCRLNTQVAGLHDTLTLQATLKNTGTTAASTVVQLYSHGPCNSRLPRPIRELRNFSKHFLEAGASVAITLHCPVQQLCYFNAVTNSWALEGGEYEMQLGFSSRDIVAKLPLTLTGDGKEQQLPNYRTAAADYFNLPLQGELTINSTAFTSLYGKPLPTNQRNTNPPFTAASTLRDMQNTGIGKLAVKILHSKLLPRLLKASPDSQTMLQTMAWDMPMHALPALSAGAVTPKQIQGLIDIANGHTICGIGKIIRR